jgi:hypothetical protein
MSGQWPMNYYVMLHYGLPARYDSIYFVVYATLSYMFTCRW